MLGLRIQKNRGDESMAIGNSNTSQARSQQAPGLSTGSKLHTSTQETDNNNIEDIFAGLYQIRQNKNLLKKSPEEGAPGTKTDELIKRYQQGDEQVKGELLRSLEPTIRAGVTSIVGGDERYLTRARLITLNALKGFDPTLGVSLNTYIYNRLQGLRRISADRGNFIHVPEKSALERRQLEEIKKDYVLENGIEPSLSMLADKSGMSINKVGRLMSIFGTTSTSATRGEHGDSLEAAKRTANELYTDTFYNELPEIDKKIYEWSTGYKGSPQLDRPTMAKRLKISEAAISQHAHKIDRLAAKFDQQLTKTIYGTSSDD